MQTNMLEQQLSDMMKMDADNSEVGSSVVGSSASGTSGGEVQLTKLQADQAAEHLQLASKEDKAVKWLRVAVIGILISAAVLLSAGCGIFMRQEEHRKFEENVEANSNKILDAVYVTIQRKMEALDTLSASFTAFALETEAVWPNVTLPGYAVRAAGIRVLADTPLVNVYHFVTDEDREGWEAYVMENQETHFKTEKESEVYQRTQQDAFFAQPETDFPPELITPFPDGILDLSVVDGTTSVAPEGSGKKLNKWKTQCRYPHCVVS